jgi:gliding motility-associated-like protein
MRIVRRDVIVLLMVLNAAFCKAQVDIQVVTVNDTVCAGSNVDFTTQLTSCNGSVNYEWWVNGDSISYGSNSNLTLMAMGNAMTVMVVAHCDDNGLVGLDTSSLLIQVITPILNAGIDQTIDSGNVVTLQASGNVTQVQWYPSFLMNPSDDFEVYCIPTTTTTFMVQGSLDGCIAFDYVTVFLKNVLRIPNTFSPNEDGTNETWIIPGIENYPKNKMTIMNRFGSVLYESTPYNVVNAWSGIWADKPLPEGVYYYILDLGTGTVKKGTICIVR